MKKSTLSQYHLKNKLLGGKQNHVYYNNVQNTIVVSRIQQNSGNVYITMLCRDITHDIHNKHVQLSHNLSDRYSSCMYTLISDNGKSDVDNEGVVGETLESSGFSDKYILGVSLLCSCISDCNGKHMKSKIYLVDVSSDIFNCFGGSNRYDNSELVVVAMDEWKEILCSNKNFDLLFVLGYHLISNQGG